MTRRRLPHIYPEDKWLFLTWHLHGSVPAGTLPPPKKATAGEAFVWIDRFLDQAQKGPLHLKRDDVAPVLIETIFRGATLGHYELGAFTLMANHVHILLRPLIPSDKVTKSLKGVTAREANRILGLTGESFWQRESYDHWVRNDMEHARIVRYIENNPVKAGIVQRVEDYPWSSANPIYSSRLR